jgi:cysteinyl-tRNA synthetase
MHNAFITINHEKMSKSLGNFFLVRDVVEKFPGDIIRFYLLGTHYRSPLDFDDEKLVMASKGLDRLKNSVRLAKEALGKVLPEQEPQLEEDELLKAAQEATEAFEAAMDDDFNSAQAYAAMFELAKEINTYLTKENRQPYALTEASNTLIELGRTLGFDLETVEEDSKEDTGKLTQVMDLVLEIRQNARKNKDWGTADLIRDRVKEIGIVIEDTADGARWYLK